MKSKFSSIKMIPKTTPSEGENFRNRLYLEYHKKAKNRSKFFMAPVFKRLQFHNHDIHKNLI